MRACPSCGEGNADNARFCSACGTELAAPPTPGGEERKVVSVLFVDLVNFTARADRADPEDIRATLRVYHELLKREIERFGGTVEKFVGDAVMAVFGAPVAHEDDPERAVRSALRIVDAIDELNEERPGMDLEIRAAVNTGEALVALGARPEHGEGFVTGDVVNIASRLQGQAPPGGVVVGELTYRATQGSIDYQELDPVTVKGKGEPLALWLATGARSRFGVDVEQRTQIPLVGRQHELNLLRELFARVVRDDAVQLVTISGEPGVGKSRMLWEFQRHVDALPDLVYWRQGRCLPYGEGVTFWALGEAIKAHAGILESDGPEAAANKLAASIAEVVPDDEEQEWIMSRLAPLVGVTGEGGAGREEAFAAWRAMLEAIAAKKPLVLVFEDLHWADEQMLAFIEHLAEWATDVPILLLTTARPELFERAPEWGGGKRNATTIGLTPLSAEETAVLLASLLEQAVLPADTQAAILERAGGNPLYAEEFVRMLIDGGALVRRGRTWELAADAEIPVPDSVHALIAARLDTLSADRKSLLYDAAVIGKVFWSGALAQVGGLEPDAVRDGLHELGRKELVRPAKRSSVRDQAEFAFWHALIRDVAYAQIPRSARAEKHLAAAGWIEATAGERVGDVAELLAYHYEQALELGRAAGRSDLGELESSTGRMLVLAGQRNEELDASRAEAYYRRALSLLPAGDPQQRTATIRLLWVLGARSAHRETQQIAGSALREFRVQGDRLGEGEALLALSRASYWLGSRTEADRLTEEGIAVLEAEPPGQELVDAYAWKTGSFMMADRSRECIEWATRTIELARRVDAPRELLRAVGFRGLSRVNLGDIEGIEDVRRALRGFRELGLGSVTAVALINLGDMTWLLEGPARGLEVHREGIDFAERRGLTSHAMWTRGETTWMTYELGEWDDVLLVSDEVLASDAGRSQLSLVVAPHRAMVMLQRGEASAAEEVLRTLDRARAVGDPQLVIPALTVSAMLECERDRVSEAVELIRERIEMIEAREGSYGQGHVDSARVLAASEELDLLEELRAQDDSPIAHSRLSLLASGGILAEARGRIAEAVEGYVEAAHGWTGFGNRVEAAFAWLGAGRCLAALGRRDDAVTALRSARETFVYLGALRATAEADELLTVAAAKTS